MLRPRLLALETAKDSVRRETLDGVEHIVVPLVGMVAGVRQAANAPGPELIPPEEIAAAVPAWNGRPVTLGHPRRDGDFVSAGRPDVFEAEVVGTIFNAREEAGKLHLEAWISTSLVAARGAEAADLVKRIEDGLEVEVSAGLFADVDETSGTFEGQAYEGVQRCIRPDHMALLAAGTLGACSWADGCGAPRVSAACVCGGSCDPCRARAAGKKGGGGVKLHAQSTDPGAAPRGLVARIAAALRGRAQEALPGVGTSEVVSALYDALQGKIALGWDDWLYIETVYEADGLVVYNHNGDLYRQPYTLSADGSVALGADAVRVRITYTPLEQTATEDRTMTKAQRVTALIQSSKGRLSESQRATLEAMTDEQLDAVEAVAQDEKKPEGEGNGTAPAAPATAPSAQTPAPSAAQQPAAPAAPGSPVTFESLLAAADPVTRSVIQRGIERERVHKAGLVEKLAAHERCPYTKTELEAMEADALEGLAKLAGLDVPAADFGLRPSPRASEDDGEVEVPSVATRLTERRKAGGGR